MTKPNTSAVLLCSGTSSRMFPFSNKFMFEFFGKSIFRYQMENLLSQKTINEIFVVTNLENKQQIESEISEYFSDFQKFQKKITCTIQENLSNGMKDGVLSVEKVFNKKNNILIISSNDMVENWFLTDFLEKDTSSQICGKLCGKVVDNYFPGGYLEIDSEKNVKKIIEKPGEGNEPSNIINLVIHWFKDSKKVFELLKIVNNSEDDAYELMIQELINTGTENITEEKKKKFVKSIEYNGLWQALKYPWHILDMQNFMFKTQNNKNINTYSIETNENCFISENAVLNCSNGNIIIEEGVKIFDFAVISGPCFIGKNSIIGNHSLIRDSHIGENCCIGQGTEIARSYLRNNVFTHQSYIGDSVVDNNVNFGAGCRTGNLRHDCGEVFVLVKNQGVNSGKTKLGIFCGSDSKFGINTSFAPGICVGKNCWSYPHLFLQKNIKENAFIKPIKTNVELDIRENKN